MNTIETFMHENLGTVRVMKKDGVEWFVAKDVCDILAIKDPSMALARLDVDEKGTNTIGTPGGTQEMLVVNEYGLWQLVLTSRKPQAKEFKRWLTHEVIPAIRQNGGYIDGMEYLPEEEKIKLEAEIRELNSMCQSYRSQNKRLNEKIDYLAKVIERDTTGDLDRFQKPRKKRGNSWDEADAYDIDADDFGEFQEDLFNVSEYILMTEFKAIIDGAKGQYIDNAAKRYLIGEVDRLFIERNV